MPPLMPAAKLRPRRAEDDHQAAGHVLAAVVAHALDHGRRAAVAHAKRSPAMPLKKASPLVAP